MPVVINPTQIYLSYDYCGNKSSKAPRIYGYNIETNTWELLATTTYDRWSGTVTISKNAYYSKFKFMAYRYSSNGDKPMLYEFKVTGGTIKK